jgi:hypothetical protein
VKGGGEITMTVLTNISNWIIVFVGSATLTLISGYVWLWAFDQWARVFRVHHYFCEYIWYRNQFQKWLNETHPDWDRETKK